MTAFRRDETAHMIPGVEWFERLEVKYKEARFFHLLCDPLRSSDPHRDLGSNILDTKSFPCIRSHWDNLLLFLSNHATPFLFFFSSPHPFLFGQIPQQYLKVDSGCSLFFFSPPRKHGRRTGLGS